MLATIKESLHISTEKSMTILLNGHYLNNYFETMFSYFRFLNKIKIDI